MKLTLLICFWALPVLAKTWTWNLDSAQGREIELQLDAYYTALDYIRSLHRTPIPLLATEEESSVYGYLARNLHRPRFLLLEVSINPLPLTGAMIREHAVGTWHRADIGEQSNAIGMLTAGFPEPGALSLFLGNVANFGPGDSTGLITGRGFSGALLSVGNYHIANNRMVEDWWAEGEVKLKGSDIRPHQRLSWSFRTGTKLHHNPDIAHTLYFAIIRDRVDRQETPRRHWSDWVLRNSELEYRVDMNYSGQFTRYFLLGGKKFPAASGNWTFSLGLGVLRQKASGYRGDLAQSIDSEWALLVRPNLEF